MGSQLRDALRCLCDEIGWNYAVFWRSIGSKSPMHLVWEDGHVTEYRVEVLVNKFMAQQVHVVGEGIVGQAAATGSHQWILANNIHVSESGVKDLSELNTQFLAGIQTITVIPVLPHGVLQLGSTQMVMENIRFVNHVKNLLAQLGWVAGALLPEMTLKALSQNSQLCDGVPVIASEALPVKQAITTTLDPLVDASCSVIHGVSNPNLHINSQLEKRPGGIQGIPYNPDMKLIHPAYCHDSTSKSQDQPSVLTSGFYSSSPQFPEQHLAMLSIKSLESVKGIEPDSDNTRGFPLRPHRPIFSNCLKDSNVHLFSGKGDTGDFANSLGRFRSLPRGAKESSRIPYSNLSGAEAVQMLNKTTCSKSSQGILGVPFSNHLSINISEPVTTAGSQKQDSDLYKACDVPLIESAASGLCDQPHLSTLQDLSNPKASQENQRNKSDICDANGINVSQIKLNIKDNDDSKFPHVFPTPSASGNDLYDMLGPDYKIESFGGSFDDVHVNKNYASVHELVADDSSGMAQLDVCPITHLVNDDISGAGMFSIAGANQLLDAVVSNISYSAKENSDGGSCKTSMTNTCSPSVPVVSPRYQLIASSEQMQSKSFSLPPLLGKAEVPGSRSAKSSCSLGNKPEECSQSAGIHKSQISLWVESGQSMHSDNLSGAHNRRVDEIGKPNWKRARPGENPRPRPKDRQMIMDRVKELREIVPNGAKCSIDALLEKTIKHMVFLQSVTKHADNLKGIGEPKFINKEGGLLLKNFEGGATWAFQVGSQSMTCPIIVEDLNPPRQMLVEMLCEQRGVFLEIADLIRGLGLTILKGVMEAHKDKIWARFAVEANRDVTRMEIFLSLVRLLESTVGCSAVPQGVDNINMPHNLRHQSCIAATGSSNHLL